MSDINLNPWFDRQLRRAGPVRGFVIGAAFLVLAAWFAFASPNVSIPDQATPVFDRSLFGSDPPRRTITLPATITVAGYQLQCMECHRLFEPPRAGVRGTPIQHRNIHLNHGMNEQCLNCHDRHDRSRLSVRGGPPLSFAEVPLLCAGCHGPTYRDWSKGIHGRTNGYWDSSQGVTRRLVCTQCHDPHAPAFPPMSLLPGPHTLRLESESQPAHEEHPGANPLRRQPPAAEAAPAHGHEAATGGSH